MKKVLGDGTPSEDQVKAIIEAVDVDGSGTIDFDEFLTLMSDPKFNIVKDEQRQAFDMFDKDGNHHISVAELKEAFRNLGEFLLDLSPTNEFHLMIRELHQAKDWMTMSST